MAGKRKTPKAPLLYALGGIVFMVIWFVTQDVQHLIFVAWFSIMSKLEEMSATKSAPLHGDVWITADKGDWSNITKGPRNGSF